MAAKPTTAPRRTAPKMLALATTFMLGWNICAIPKLRSNVNQPIAQKDAGCNGLFEFAEL